MKTRSGSLKVSRFLKKHHLGVRHFDNFEKLASMGENTTFEFVFIPAVHRL